jgi:hypothetical protein
MTLEELKEALLAADPAAVLVSPHLLARVIREIHRLPPQVLQVPHRKSCILDRGTLFRYVEPDDLDLGPDRLLPPTVILLARPALDRRNALEREATLRTYWRRLFHSNVHLALQNRAEEGRLDLDVIAARIEEIGGIEFEEIRAVLHQEKFLFFDADDRDVYMEFAAVYLGLRHFLPDLPPVYFPAIRDYERIDRILARDVDASAIFRRTRLAGAADPGPRPDDNADEPSDACVKLIRDARRAARAGNSVRAAILRTRAARIAPAALTLKAEADAREDLKLLTTRLQAALKLSDADVHEWLDMLLALLDKASEGEWSVEARLLYDLQKACTDHELDVFALDLVEWALSFGKRPIKRPLPSQRIVRVLRDVRSASGKLTPTRLSETDRQHLARLIHDALRQGEERLRARFRPVLSDALYDVGVRAGNAPEQAALYKMIEELLDRIIAFGFFTFSDLRDAISRNNLKLPDLRDAREFVRGDPLLQLDKRLATALDGVYRPSEIYLRLLQRVTAPNFGTRVGRWITRNITFPFGASLLILEGIDRIIYMGYEYLDRTGDFVPLFGPLSVLLGMLFPSYPPATYPTIAPSLFVALALFLFGVFYRPRFRRGVKATAKGVWRAGKWLLIDAPTLLVPLPMLRAMLKSWPFQLFYGLFLMPLLVCTLLWWFFPTAFADRWRAALIFLAVELVFNTRPVHAAGDALTRGSLRIFDWLRSGLVPGLFRLIIRLFKQVTDGVEYVLYTVDEWLRFRSGDSRFSMVLRALIGVLWFPISYVARLYIVVLIEPGFNPLKAPVSILAAKFVYPIVLAAGWDKQLPAALTPYLSAYVAIPFAGMTLWLLPDLFGFLFWEMKENWRLYRANRPAHLGPVSVGPRGETLLHLLRPGFHTGTVPRLYAQWRYAGRQAYETGAWRAARACRESLLELEEAFRRFIEREVLIVLHQSPGWRKRPLSVGEVALASNVVRLALRHASHPETPLRLAIAERDGLLIASIEDPSWLPDLPPAELATLMRALGGMFNLAGVDRLAQTGMPPELIAWSEWVEGWRREQDNGTGAKQDTVSDHLQSGR